MFALWQPVTDVELFQFYKTETEAQTKQSSLVRKYIRGTPNNFPSLSCYTGVLTSLIQPLDQPSA